VSWCLCTKNVSKDNKSLEFPRIPCFLVWISATILWTLSTLHFVYFFKVFGYLFLLNCSSYGIAQILVSHISFSFLHGFWLQKVLGLNKFHLPLCLHICKFGVCITFCLLYIVHGVFHALESQFLLMLLSVFFVLKSLDSCWCCWICLLHFRV